MSRINAIKIDKIPSCPNKTVESPVISIIAPCYNGEKFIRKAILSVLNQSYRNWELIIVDDGSTDRSKALIRPYLGDTRIRLLENSTNKGIPQTKNRALSEATGEYVAFIDQDDTWTSDKLEQQLSCFISSGESIGAVCAGMKLVDSRNRLLDAFSGFSYQDHRNTIKNIYLTEMHSSSIMMTRRDIFNKVGTFNESLKGWDDYELLMRIGVYFRILYVRKFLVIKKIHGENAQNRPEVIQETDRVFHQIIRMYPWLKAYDNLKASQKCSRQAKRLLSQGETKLAKRQLKKAIRLNPAGLHARLILILVCLTDRSALKILTVTNRLFANILIIRIFFANSLNRTCKHQKFPKRSK